MVDKSLRPLLDLRLTEWAGLTNHLAEDMMRMFGPASSSENVQLGAYPALRERYSLPEFAAAGLIVYSRAHRVVAVESDQLPPVAAIEALGRPDVCKPPELHLLGYLVREHLYCGRGLVLSVAEALNPSANPSSKIVRCRGIRVLAGPQEYGAEYYLALQDSLVFSAHENG